MPSTRKHQPSLETAINIPASDGPMRRATFTMEELMAMAFCRSRLSSTIMTMKDWRPGISKALMQPCMTLSVSSRGMVMWPESVNAARVSDWTMERVWVQTSTWRRSSRSTHTPAKGATRKVGIWPAKLTVPSSRAEPVSR